MSREHEIAQGLREPSGALIGGLHVFDYVQGIEDFKAGRQPPEVTTTSYDLGRARESKKAEERVDLLTALDLESDRRNDRIREMLAGRPEILAEFNANIAAARKLP